MAYPDSTVSRSGPQRGASPMAILFFISIGQFMVFLDVTIVNLALPSIQRGLAMSDVSLNYIVTAYATVLGGFLLLCGRLADTYGRRRILQIGFVVFSLASAAAALSQNGPSLVTARGFQGLGAAMIATSALSILTNTFAEGAERNKALGIWGSLSGVAGVLGVVLGGALSDGPGWQWIFWLNVPVGLAAAVAAPRVLPEGLGVQARRFDFAGAVTLTSGLLLLIFTLGESTHVGWASARTIGSLVGVAVLLGSFLVIESRVDEPMMPLQIFRLRTMATANLSAVLTFGTMSAMFFFISIFMQRSFGYSPLRAGMAYLPVAFGVAAGAGIASTLTKTARPMLIAGLSMMVAGLLILWRTPAGSSYAAHLLPAFLVLALGTGVVFVTLQIAAFVGIKNEDAGVAAGLYNTSQEAGGALGLAVIATIAYSGLADRIARSGGNPGLIQAAETAAHHRAFLTAACIGTGAIFVALIVMPRKKPAEPAAAAPLAGATAPVVEAQPSDR